MDALAVACALGLDDPDAAIASLDWKGQVAARAIVLAMPCDHLCDLERLAHLQLAVERAIEARLAAYRREMDALEAQGGGLLREATQGAGMRARADVEPLERLRCALAGRIRGGTVDAWAGEEGREAERAEEDARLVEEAYDPWEHAVY